ncbi:MAG TPA: Hsp20/alpha crystallin family protein [Chitinophagaceae bacterium]|nr:Hsp20/alpha crystallin family protein [Chitinophagaceae bacterium]
MAYLKINNRPFEKSANNFVDELFRGLPDLFNENSGFVLKEGHVPVNIKETGNEYILEVIAPGFNKADFKIKLDANILTVSAEKKEDEITEADKVQPEKQIRREYSYKSFKRSFTIDDKTDATGIEASYVNGVMILNLPKRKEVREAAKEIIIK